MKEESTDSLNRLNKENNNKNEKITQKEEKKKTIFLKVKNLIIKEKVKKDKKLKRKVLFGDIIIILIISFISNSTCQRYLKFKDSTITLKFSSRGVHKVFHNEICTVPNEIYINEVKQNSVNTKYDLNSGDIVKLVWKNNINECKYMFYNCNSIVEIIFNNFDISLCVETQCMFKNCESLISLDLSSLDTTNVEVMNSMFYGCYSLTSINLNNIDASKVTNMGHMFYNCISLKSIDLSSFFIVKKIQYIDNMFNGCKNLTFVNLSNLDTSNVIKTENIFYGCTSLKSIDFSNLKITSKMAYMENMFINCDNLEYIDLKNLAINNNINNNFFKGTAKNLVICTNDNKLINKIKNDKCIVNKCLDNWYDFKKKINLENDECYYTCISTDYKYEYDYKCHKSCPQENYNGKCIEEKKDDPNIYDILLKNIERDFTSIFYDTQKIDEGYDEIIEFFNLKVTLTTNKNQKNDINNGKETNLDLGDCEAKLKKEYHLADDEILYIRKIDVVQEGMKIPKVEYDIYSKLHGEKLIKLNLSYCSNTKIDIYVPVNLTESLDKHNSKSGYYNDLCYPSSSDSGTDIILSDRKNEFIKNNKTICQDNCFVSQYNYNIKQVKCTCDVKQSSQYFHNIKINKEKLLDNFINVKNIININILVCYKQLFSKNGFIKNYCNYLMIIIIILHFIIIISFYFGKFIEKMKEKINYIFLAKRNFEFPGMKEKRISPNQLRIIKKQDKSKKAKNYLNIKKFSIQKNKKSIPISNSENGIIIAKINKQQKENKNNKKNKDDLFKKYDSTKKKDYSILKLRKIMALNDSELNYLSYKLALVQDKRNFCQYYFSLLKIKHDIVFSFYTSNDYNIKIIKIDLFFFNLAFFFVINALFFNDDTMHKIYQDEGSFNFIYQLPQILYSTLISNFISIFIKMLSLTQDDILNFKINKRMNNLNSKRFSLIKKLKIKFLLYFIFSSLFLLFFWYYLSMFCAIYVNTQIHLIKDTLLSFILSLIYPLIFYFIPTLFRIIALSKPRSKRIFLYKVSQFIENLF